MTEACLSWKFQRGWNTTVDHIRHCRVTKMYKSEQKRLEVSVPLEMYVTIAGEGNVPDTVEGLIPTWAWTMIKNQIIKCNLYMAMEGRVPSGDMERRIQDWLDQNQD